MATTSSVTEPGAPARPEVATGPVPPTRWAVAAAVVAGPALVVAFPPYDMWWTAPVGVALLALATHRRSGLAGAALGLVTGMGFFAPLLHWTAIDARIGWWPWLVLALSQAAFVALLGAAAAWCSRVADRWVWSWPLLTGALWTAQEALRSRQPFGGFPWGRLAFSQADSPLVWLASLGGAPLVSFAVATIGGLLAAAVWWAWRDRTPPRWWVRPAAAVGAAILVPLASWAVPYTPPSGPQVTVAIVQGNVPRIGLDFNAQRRAVLDNHVNATIALAERVDRGEVEAPDLVVWPENSSDIDPLQNSDARQRIDEAANAIGVPILVGAVLAGPGESTRNTGLVWVPGRGPVDMYVKQHPVPFAEYMPMRPFVRMITKKADLAGRFVPGDEPGVLRLGSAVLGDVICFEVAYDNLVRDTVTQGAQLIVVQTNNATFNAAEAKQQLAMVRLRAVEHARPSLMASTVGVSGFVAPDGTVSDTGGFFTAHTAVRTLRLGEARTLATRVGAVPELILSVAALIALGTGFVLRRTVSQDQRRPDSEELNEG